MVEHDSAVVESQHGPSPVVISLLDAEAELLIELDTCRQICHRKHRNETGHLHEFVLLATSTIQNQVLHATMRFARDGNLPIWSRAMTRPLCLLFAAAIVLGSQTV